MSLKSEMIDIYNHYYNEYSILSPCGEENFRYVLNEDEAHEMALNEVELLFEHLDVYHELCDRGVDEKKIYIKAMKKLKEMRNGSV